MSEKRTITERLGGTTDEEVLAEYKGIDAESLSYDFFKHLTSLSILVLGGVLTLSQEVFSESVEDWQMFAVAGMIALGGLIALQCQSDIVQVARGKKSSSSVLRWGHRIAPAFFGAGIGVFLATLVGLLG